MVEVSISHPKLVQRSQKQIPTTRYSRQSAETVEETIAAVLMAAEAETAVPNINAIESLRRGGRRFIVGYSWPG
ncbi:hypothetical protein PSEUDO8Z_10457 [Pseudomonas sp. 8Z]|nr:hypothetical protein PSEUDO8Z_10457 [Pseudomonas sp. 8Z]